VETQEVLGPEKGKRRLEGSLGEGKWSKVRRGGKDHVFGVVPCEPPIKRGGER